MKTTIRLFLTLTILRALTGSMTGAIYVKYLHLHGLSLLETNLVNCIFYGALILLDVPTGAFADVFGRKKAILLSFVFAAAAEFIYGSSSSIGGFIMAELTMAVAHTLLNGALRAWFVDQLKFNGHHGDLTDLFGRANVAGWVACIPGGIIGGQLLAINPSYPWFLCGIIVTATGIFAMFYMKEEYFLRKNVSLRRSYKIMCLTIRVSIRHVRKNAVVRFIILSSIAQIFTIQAPNMQWVPRFSEIVGDGAMLGYAMAGFAIMGAFGSFMAKRILKTFRNEESMIMWCQISIGVLIIASGIVPGILGFAFFMLHQIARGLYAPVKDAYFQDHISSRERATMSSFESIVPNVGGMVALATTGLMAEKYGIPLTWSVSGSILILAALVIAATSRPKKTV